MPDHEQTPGDLSAELVAAVRAGSPEAWQRLVEQYAKLVLTIPREFGLTESDAEEVFQATWTSLYRHLPLIRRPAALPAWIITTARRESWRLRRRAQRLEGAEDVHEAVLEDPAPDPLGETLGLERRQLLQEALDEVSERCQKLLARIFFHAGSGSYEAIAKDLDMPLGSVGPSRMRCLADLARILERRGFR